MNKTKTFKATFLQHNSVTAKKAYVGEGGFLNVYWFEVEQDNGYTTVLPYILDYTYEIWEAKWEYWAIIQPLQSYQKKSMNSELLGTTCFLKASTDKNGFPISIQSILMAQTN